MNQYVEVTERLMITNAFLKLPRNAKNLATLKITKNESCTG